jgi:uncharacterized protein (DUF983 family)
MYHYKKVLRMAYKTLVSVLKKTLRNQCPQCGTGRLYLSFLKLAPSCTECAEDFSHIRADDAPAWLTIFIVGHIMTPIVLILLSMFDYPDWLLTVIIIIPSVIMSLIILPFAKSLFIGILWYQKQKDKKSE